MSPLDPAVASPVGLLAAGADDPERVWLSLQEPDGAVREVTYAEALDRARRVASGLASLGVGAGGRVHVHLPNQPEFYDVWFAAGLLKATIVPTNPQAPAAELAPLLVDARPAVSVTTAALAPLVRLAAPGQPVVTTDGAGAGDLPAFLAAERHGGDGERPWPTGSDLAAILYTSGTTGRAKGVMITNENYVRVGQAVGDHVGVRPDDRWLVVLPLFHANAQYYTTMSALVSGASIALAPRFSASSWSSQVAAHGVTLGSLAATPVRMILHAPEHPCDADNRLRVVLFGQNVTDAQAAAFERRFGARLIQLYGMTETVLPPTMNPISDERRWASIGRSLPGVEIRLLGADGSPVPTGTPGEMHVGGEPGRSLAAGYLNQPEETDRTFGGGWLRTGDLATVDADGFYYFVERAKDIVKRGGENVSVTEVEIVVAEHPSVADAAAIGVPDALRDEAVLAFVVADPARPVTAEALEAWCRERLAPFKVPSGFAFVDALPRTSIGKVNRQELRGRPEATDLVKRLEGELRA